MTALFPLSPDAYLILATMSSQNTILFIGATGYLGSEFLVILNQKLPNFHVVTLLRNATQERRKQLQAVYPNSSIVEGTLNDDAIITEQAAKADIVINCASSDHLPSVMCVCQPSFSRSMRLEVTFAVGSNIGRLENQFEEQSRETPALYTCIWVWHCER